MKETEKIIGRPEDWMELSAAVSAQLPDLRVGEDKIGRILRNPELHRRIAALAFLVRRCIEDEATMYPVSIPENKTVEDYLNAAEFSQEKCAESIFRGFALGERPRRYHWPELQAGEHEMFLIRAENAPFCSQDLQPAQALHLLAFWAGRPVLLEGVRCVLAPHTASEGNFRLYLAVQVEKGRNVLNVNEMYPSSYLLYYRVKK